MDLQYIWKWLWCGPIKHDLVYSNDGGTKSIEVRNTKDSHLTGELRVSIVRILEEIDHFCHCTELYNDSNVYVPYGNDYTLGISMDGLVQDALGLYSLSSKTSYCKILWSLEAAKFRFRLFQPLCNLIGISTAGLASCLANLERYDHSSIQSCSFKTPQDLTVRRLST